MIKTLSPHYISIPFVNPTTSVVCEYYTLNLIIYTGNKNTVPTTVDYAIRKNNSASSNGTDSVNISRIVNSYLEFTPKKASVTSLLDGKNQMWLYYYVEYSDNLTVKEQETTCILVKGYGYGNEGSNPVTPSNKVMITGSEFDVNRQGVLSLGIYLDDV